ncbi:unnamed protein product [Prunus armeniaca]
MDSSVAKLSLEIMIQLDMIETTKSHEFAQADFRGYKSLNRMQSRIFRTVYYTNENILVCAPTGAGKTNIAVISILHESLVLTLRSLNDICSVMLFIDVVSCTSACH